MISSDVVMMLGLYQNHPIVVTYQNGDTKTGILQQFDLTENLILIDGSHILLTDIHNLEYCGVIGVDDYQTYHQSGLIDGVYKFSSSDLLKPDDLAFLYYHEFECNVACHLSIQSGIILATDVRILSKKYILNSHILAGKQYLYRFNNGHYRACILPKNEKGMSNLDGIDLSSNQITDVTKSPSINDTVIAVTDDNRTYRGLVCYVQADSFNIFCEGSVSSIAYENIRQLRYLGTVTDSNSGRSVIDTQYVCKTPYYLCNPDDEAFMKHGAKVSYVIGINSRGLIAKDVILEQGVIVQKPTEYFGILLTVDFTKENGFGYIGNRYVSKACGRPVSGKTRFMRKQMDFEIEYNKAYIIKYTADHDSARNLRIVKQMTVYKTLDASAYGIIDVSDNGDIHAIPLFQANTERFVNRDVDVICKNGQTCSGLLQSFDEQGLTISDGNDEGAVSTVIPFDEIDDILLIGTVTQYYQNGTGYVDNAFFFHINEMEKSVDAQFVRTGTQLIFSLRNARKGNFVDCRNIRILKEQKLDVYVIDYSNKKYTVVDAEKYGKGIQFRDEAYQVLYDSYNQFRDLKNEDYHAVLTMSRKFGKTICSYIRIINSQPKLRVGIVTNVDLENHTVSILPKEQYRKNNAASVYPLEPSSSVERMSAPKEKDYEVLYTLSVQDRTYVAHIQWVDNRNAYDKCHFGYLGTYFEDKSSGFITPEALFEQWPKPRHSDIYCKYTSFENPPELLDLIDTKCMYRVCYTVAPYANSRQDRPPAKKVWFLEKVERPQRNGSVSFSATPSPSVLTSPSQDSTEDINLITSYPLSGLEDVQWAYGIVTAFSPKFSSLRIFKNFQNKRMVGVDDDFIPELLAQVTMPENGASLSGEYAEKINTTKNVYLIRFAAVVSETGTPEVDLRHPIEFLREFRKNTLKAMYIKDDTLHVETGQIIQKPSPVLSELSVDVPEGEAPYISGETIIIQKNGSFLYAGELDTVKGNQFIFSDGQFVEAEDSDVIRFGVLTHFNDNMTIGYLNGSIPFSFANMDSRTFNMIKTAKKSQLLWYTCQNSTVNHIERITSEFLDKTPFRWQHGIVTNYVADTTERCIMINDDIRYLLTVATGGYIWGLVKANKIIDTPVYAKTINCVFSEDDEVEIRAYALDIHSEHEFTLIHYDAVSDNYLAAQNASKPAILEGSRTVLASLVDSHTNVHYRVTDGGRELQAYIDSSQDDTEWVESGIEEDLDVSKVLVDSFLVQHHLRKVDYVSLLPWNAELTQEKVPVDLERTIMWVGKNLSNRMDFSKAIALVSLLRKLPEDRRIDVLKRLSSTVKFSSVDDILWKALNHKIRMLGRENNCLWGEYSYYMTTTMNAIHDPKRLKEEIYKFFLQDFYSRIEVMEELQRLNSIPSDRKIQRISLRKMFKRSVLGEDVGQLVAHMFSLDEASFQHLIVSENVLDDNPVLTKQIIDWGGKLDQVQNFDSASNLINHLRVLYRSDKSRFTKELAEIAKGSDVLDNTERVLSIISHRFVRLITTDDAVRFADLLELVQKVNATRRAGYQRYQNALMQSWNKCQDLLKTAELHLTQETTEMLLNTGLMNAVLEEIERELNELYASPEYLPDIRCSQNTSEVIPSQQTLCLLVENGITGRTNLQSAYNVKLRLEVLSGLPNDSIPNIFPLKERVLHAGGEPLVLDTIELNLSALDGDAFAISVSAEYECCSGFQEREIRTVKTTDCGILEFQIRGAQSVVKNKNAVNYYLHPAEGNPLKETDANDSSMFFGRKEEIKEIWNSIIDENNILREGRAIMLYGQKKCGKTSLINQIIGDMKNNAAIREQAIILSVKDILEMNGGVTGLAGFSLNFYQTILNMLNIELMLRHKNVKKKLTEFGLTIPNLKEHPGFEAAEFQNFFMQFTAIDEGKHRIVLVMDEFTRLCTTILDQRESHPEYLGIPNFIKLFSSMGFVQIIIGHPNMMRALSQLGIINHTAEFAKRIELSALKYDEACALIQKPMERSFGFDVYSTRLGKRAMERLISLSGCHPSVLMKLCNQMFFQYMKSDYPHILLQDVENMLAQYLEQLEANTTFDIMVLEDGDDPAFFEYLPTYQYLKQVALESLHSNNWDCYIDLVCPELGEEKSRDVRETLISRRVLAAGNGRIKIPTELFLEYIRYKYETH